jgi:hypothetical protein
MEIAAHSEDLKLYVAAEIEERQKEIWERTVMNQKSRLENPIL